MSRTRSPNRVVQAAGQPEDVAAGADVDAGDEHALVGGELGLERVADRVHRAERPARRLGRWRGRLGTRRSGSDDEVVQRRRRRVPARRGPRRPRRRARARPTLRSAATRVVGDAGVAQAVPRGPRAGRAPPTPAPPRACGSAPGRPRSGRASGRWSASTMTGPAAGADAVDHVVHHGRRGGDDVVAVDRDVVDAVARRPAARACAACCVGRRRELGVAVVLAEEDHRQLPHRGEVDRLVERALRDGAVAEERDRDACRRRAAAPRSPRRRRSAGRRRRCRWRRRCRASGSAMCIEPPRPAVGAVVLGHQLGEHAERVEALGQAVAVAAVGRGDDVGRPERPARADRGRLLADRQVHEARAPRRRGRAPTTRCSKPRITSIRRCISSRSASRRGHGPMYCTGRYKRAGATMTDQIEIPDVVPRAGRRAGQAGRAHRRQPGPRPAARPRVLARPAPGSRWSPAPRPTSRRVAAELPGPVARAAAAT